MLIPGPSSHIAPLRRPSDDTDASPNRIRVTLPHWRPGSIAPPQHPGRQLRCLKLSEEYDVADALTPDLTAWIDCAWLIGAAMLATASRFTEPKE